MSTRKTIKCKVYGSHPASKMRKIMFSTGTELNMVLTGEIGPNGITTNAADLVDFAAAIYQIERQLRFQGTNIPERFKLSIRLRDPSSWNSSVIRTARDILLLLGNAEWDIELEPGLRAKIPDYQPTDKRQVDQIVLFSGGMDSTCGLSSIQKEVAKSRLVSFYTLQRALQRNIASELGFNPPVQWRMLWEPKPGRGHTFYYRSFLFLCLAAAVAESWKVRKILQFENGILASAIPPSPAWMMTKHAHPELHKLISAFFSAFFGEEWQVKNPFLLYTKRDCYNEAMESIGRIKSKEIVHKTETCWFFRSNRVVGGKKKPGIHCGVCIPCILRRTALQDDMYQWDLRKDSIRNDQKLGISFRSYYGFLEQVAKTKNSSSEFYRLLPAPGRSLVAPEGPISLQDLHKLFLRFSKEFIETYQQ